jgi:hypothetical protein
MYNIHDDLSKLQKFLRELGVISDTKQKNLKCLNATLHLTPVTDNLKANTQIDETQVWYI